MTLENPAASIAATEARQTGIEAVAPEVPTLRNRRGRTLVGGFAAAHFTHHVSNSMLTPLLPLIRDNFALSYAQSGFLITAFSMSLGLSNAPVGYLADKVGSRPVVAAGLVLTGVASAALALAGAYWQLLLLLVFMGTVAATYHAPSAALLAQAFPTQSRGAAMGFHITGGHLSFFATPLVAAALVAGGETWRTPFLLFAFAPILMGVALWFLAPRHREQGGGSSDRLAVFRELRTVIKTVGPLVSLSILCQVFYAALLAFMTLYLVDARGLAPELAAALFGAPHFVGLFGAPLAGYLSDRLGRQTVILLGMGTLGPAFWALTSVPNELILLPLALIGLSAAMRQTVTEVLVMDSAPPHRRATILGSYYMLSQELGGLGAPLLGLMAGALGIGAAYGSTALVLAALSVVVLVIGRKL
ncbi:MAG: MFS transporter [Chloroflexi bacterium]|nr:MFS transporter [Chloroflexota bacterium]